jgi:ABC-2 type transport system ATP-binding protein
MIAVNVKNLTKKFGNLTAVDGISFSIEEGEIFGLLGPNGAGKTTTISMLSTLLSPTSGEASVNSFEISKSQDSVRHSIGIVFQDPTLDDELTAYENLDFHGRLYGVPSEVRKKKIIELLNLVELEERKDSLVKTFSGGMKRRLEIARGLLHEPKVLFLDEPTLGLDPQTRNKLWEYIERLNREKNLTIILTTHYMEEADKLCNRVAIIDHGKIIAIDKPENLKNNIGGDVITIETQKATELSKVFNKIGPSKAHDGSLTISISHADKKVAGLVELAEKSKIKIDSIMIHKPSLEDVFLYYTGRTIREEESSEIDTLRKRRQMWGGGRR